AGCGEPLSSRGPDAARRSRDERPCPAQVHVSSSLSNEVAHEGGRLGIHLADEELPLALDRDQFGVDEFLHMMRDGRRTDPQGPYDIGDEAAAPGFEPCGVLLENLGVDAKPIGVRERLERLREPLHPVRHDSIVVEALTSVKEACRPWGRRLTRPPPARGSPFSLTPYETGRPSRRGRDVRRSAQPKEATVSGRRSSPHAPVAVLDEALGIASPKLPEPIGDLEPRRPRGNRAPDQTTKRSL